MAKLGSGPDRGDKSLGGKPEKRTIAKSIEKEEELAETLGGRRTAASGSTDLGGKGDVRLSHFCFDRKETDNTTMMTLYLRDLTKCGKDAGRLIPGMNLVFNHLEGSPTPHDWVMIPLEVFAKMIEAGQHNNLDKDE